MTIGNKETGVTAHEESREFGVRRRAIGRLIIVLLAISYGIASDRLVIRDARPPFTGSLPIIELNSLFNLPVQYPHLDISNTDPLNRTRSAKFYSRIVSDLSKQVKPNTKCVFMNPDKGIRAQGWPYASQDWLIEFEIAGPNSSQFTLLPSSTGGMLWWGFWGNCAVFLAVEMSFVLAFRAASIFIDGRHRRTGFPVIVHAPNNDKICNNRDSSTKGAI